jgi:putative hydrolase of the HAD superfamily
VFLDAGGVVVLPDPGLIRRALAPIGLDIDPSAVPRAHYRAIRDLDRLAPRHDAPVTYIPALCSALGIGPGRHAEAVAALLHLADRRAAGEILWSAPAPRARPAIEVLTRAGIVVVIVTNSDGRAAENLRDAGICQTGPGAGVRVAAVIDSARVGAAKPDPRIFAVALEQVGARPQEVVHIGDRLATDIAGARAAGIAAIHLDPLRACRSHEHRHVRTLAGVWQHIAAAQTPSDSAQRPSASSTRSSSSTTSPSRRTTARPS